MYNTYIGALKNYRKSDNITKLLTELKWAIKNIERTNVTIIFADIRTSKSTYYLRYDNSHFKIHTTKTSMFNFDTNFGFTS